MRLFAPLTRTIEESLSSARYTINSALEDYAKAIEESMEELTETMLGVRAFEEGARVREYYSRVLEGKIVRLRSALESNYHILESLLVEFEMVSCLPLIEDNEGNDFVTPSYSSATANYNDGQNILTHLVRDYGEGSSGHSVFFTDRIARQRSRGPSNEFSVLVPGAGLCRLGIDLASAFEGSTVEMNESSYVMVAAANSIVNGVNGGWEDNNNNDNAPLEIFPFASETFIDEISSERRFERMKIDGRRRPSRENISLQVGDFVSIYSHELKRNQYDFVATNYFIDCADNLLEFIIVIQSVLKEGGIWINRGPLHWHRSSKIRPTVEEMMQLLLEFGFEIMEYNVASTAENYRTNSDGSSYTKIDHQYLPLQFQVRKVGGGENESGAGKRILKGREKSKIGEEKRKKESEEIPKEVETLNTTTIEEL